MNYDKIYDLLIARAQTRIFESSDYYEIHHIVPRCVGGADTNGNLVALSPEEHYVAHQLLVKMLRYRNCPNWGKLVYAANMMTVGKFRNNKKFGWLRRRLAIEMSNDNLGKKQSAATIEARRLKITGLKRSDETREKMKKPKSPEHRAKLAEASKISGEKRRGKPGPKHTDEAKKKITGRKPGTPMSEAQKQAVRERHTGKKLSEETRARMSAATKLVWQKRKGQYNNEL